MSLCGFIYPEEIDYEIIHRYSHLSEDLEMSIFHHISISFAAVINIRFGLFRYMREVMIFTVVNPCSDLRGRPQHMVTAGFFVPKMVKSEPTWHPRGFPFPFSGSSGFLE